FALSFGIPTATPSKFEQFTSHSEESPNATFAKAFHFRNREFHRAGTLDIFNRISGNRLGRTISRALPAAPGGVRRCEFKRRAHTSRNGTEWRDISDHRRHCPVDAGKQP